MTQKELYTNIIKAYKVLDEFEKAKMFLEHYIKNVTSGIYKVLENKIR